MNATLLEQTSTRLTSEVRHWDRRLRLVQSLLWGPRGMMAGLIVTIGIAVLSRTRPWLLPKDIAFIAVGLIAAGCVLALAAVWFWPPHATHRRARYFDRKFDLKERVSTALEVTNGVLPLPSGLVEHQLSDAVQRAQRVDVQAKLPFRVRVAEIIFLLALGALAAYLLILPNPQAEALIERRNLQNAINTQAQNMQQALQQIQANSSLTPEERAALSKPIEQALNTLQQPNISQQEALAAMAQAEQELRQLSDGMTADQQAAYQQAASQLAGSDMTDNAAEALSRPDLGQAAAAMEDMANRIAQGNLSNEERQALADKLQQTADSLRNDNPALSQDLQNAADALRNGDMQAAEDALRKAAQDLQNQQQQLNNSEMAQTAQNLKDQFSQDRQELAQSGQENSNQNLQANQQEQQQGDQQQQTGQQGQQQGQQGDQQQGQQSDQQGQQGDQQQQAGQQGQQQGQQGDQQQGQQSDQQGQQGDQQQQTGQQGQQQGDQSGQQQGQQSGQQGQQGSEQQAQGQSSEGSSSAGEQQGDQQGSAQSGQTQTDQASQEGQQGQDTQSSLSAGQGEGGQGVDTTSGVEFDQQSSSSSSQNDPSANGEGSVQQYSPEYNPSSIGGQSNSTLDVGGQSPNAGNTPVQQGDFSDNPSGQSQLSYSGVYNNYRDMMNSAMQSGRIPLSQRDVIHDYFSSLEP